MSPSAKQPGGSRLLVDECFQTQDDRFLEALGDLHAPKALAGLADRWKQDPRPWARAQAIAYLAQPLDRLGHNVVVKRLFKHAEQAGDDELMARFLVAFDALVRRVRKTRWHHDWRANETWSEEVLATPRNTLPRERTREVDPLMGREREVPSVIPPSGRLFSYRTRYYLRRRAWRYFRRMGYQRPQDYVEATARALAVYRDEDLAQGENILDSWGLMQACFRGHDALEFGATSIRLREGRSLSELSPAPRFAHLWQQPDAAVVLLSLLSGAESRLVRVWAMQLLKREHAGRLAEMTAEEILCLLAHDDEEVQQFGAELLLDCPELGKMPAATWLKLLQTKSTLALEAICQAMQKHVTAERLELADCIQLARAEPAPVARLGLEMLKQRRIESAEDRDALAAVADARCFATAGELATWALGLLGRPEVYQRELVLRFFDSLSQPVRHSAWQWLTGEGSPGYDDPGLWCRLLETPYDDVRLGLVDELQRRAALPGTSADDLRPVWCSVLLGVHRGGRQKAKATRQIAEAVQRDPSCAEQLLPVLAVAVRSVRPAEVRSGLAAVVAAAEARPEIVNLIQQHLPELSLTADGVSG